MKNFNQIANCPITFHVNNEKKTVVAVMRDTENILVDYLLNTDLGQRKESIAIVPFPVHSKRVPYLYMRKCYSAQVHCHPDDEFNIEQGKREAKRKLMRNVYRAFSRRFSRYILHIDNHKASMIQKLKQLDAENN